MPLVIEALPEFYLPKAKKLAEAFSLETTGTDEMVFERVVAFLKSFQQRIGAITNFAQWAITDQVKTDISDAIKKDICFQFYPMSEEKIDRIITAAV